MIDKEAFDETIAFLKAMEPAERHAVARLFDFDPVSLKIYRWIVDQADCDLATAAMIFWRLRGAPGRHDTSMHPDRAKISNNIAAKVAAHAYPRSSLWWDGREVWDDINLIGHRPFQTEMWDSAKIPATMSGPFAGERPPSFESMRERLDSPGPRGIAVDDMFDENWYVRMEDADKVDGLLGCSADQRAVIWTSQADEWMGEHPDHVYQWMVSRPECPQSTAAFLFFTWGPVQSIDADVLNGATPATDALHEAIIKRWRTTGFVNDGFNCAFFVSDEQREDFRHWLADDPGLAPFSTLYDPQTGTPIEEVSEKIRNAFFFREATKETEHGWFGPFDSWVMQGNRLFWIFTAVLGAFPLLIPLLEHGGKIIGSITMGIWILALIAFGGQLKGGMRTLGAFVLGSTIAIAGAFALRYLSKM